MKFLNTKTDKILSNESDETISIYYDGEQTKSQRLRFEAVLAVSGDYQNRVNKELSIYQAISNTINLLKFLNKNKASAEVDKFLKNYKGKSVINLNTMFFKGINKFLGNFFLNADRDNTQQFNRF